MLRVCCIIKSSGGSWRAALDVWKGEKTIKSDRPYPFVTIDARGAKRAQQGHPWVFDNEITAQEGALEDGALCDVRSPKGRYLGTGTYNSH